MSQTISTTNKPQGNGLASFSQSHKPQISQEITWRLDGERGQIVILHSPRLALPQMLNPTAARIFLLATGENTIEVIASKLCEEFNNDDFNKVLEDVKGCLVKLSEKEIIHIQ